MEKHTNALDLFKEAESKLDYKEKEIRVMKE